MIPPKITTPPRDIEGELYGTVQLVCQATGNPTPTIEWFKDGSNITVGRTPTLMFTELALKDRGFYHCLARSREVNDSSSDALLTIAGKTAI